MQNAIERAVETYVRAWCERDPTRRERLLEECFAADGRFVTRGKELRGRTALAADMERFHANVPWRRIRRLSVVDTGATTFRFRGVVELKDGASAESYDFGEVDGEGKICLLLTFDGPLADTTTEI